jgi:hypothetical protein
MLSPLRKQGRHVVLRFRVHLQIRISNSEPTGRAKAPPMTGSAKQSISPSKERMDCFATLAMTRVIETHVRIPAAQIARAMHGPFAPPNRERRECRALGAPAAARGVVNTRVSHHGHTGNTRHSPRNGFNGFLRALPGDRAFLSPSPHGFLSAKLDAGVEASGPHDFAVREISALVSRAFRVHRIPPRVRDDRDTPLASPKPARMSERAAVAKPPVAGTEPVTPQRR